MYYKKVRSHEDTQNNTDGPNIKGEKKKTD